MVFPSDVTMPTLVLLVGIAWIPLVSLAIQGISALAGAKAASGGAKKAAQTQSQSLDKAIRAVTAAHQQGQQFLNPYAVGGTRAFDTMLSLSGLGAPVGGGSASTAATGPLAPATDKPTVPWRMTGNEQYYPAHWQVYDEELGRPIDPATGQPIGKWQIPMSDLQQNAQTQRSSGYVPMQAPDGSVQQVPIGAVNYYAQRGARVMPTGPTIL